MTTDGLSLDSTKLAASVARVFLESQRLAYARISPELRLIEFSANFPAMAGRQADIVAGMPLTDLLWEFAESEEALHDVMVGKAAAFRLDYIFRAGNDGDPCYFSYHVVSIDDKHPEKGLLLLIEEVTSSGNVQQRLVQDRNELWLAQRELARLNEELTRINRLKSLFLSMAAHDLRTPLTSIRGYSRLLLSQSTELSAEHQKLLRIISAQSDKLDRLITDLLDLDQIEKARIKIKPKACELREIISEVLESVSAYARDQGKAISAELPERPMPLRADPRSIWRILHNLVGNAVKYTQPGGRILVKAWQTENETTFQVTDDGLGMSQAQITSLFQLYYRTEEAIDSEITGTGVGLFIVKTLIDAHGGSIEVSSLPDRGSTFTVRLPSTL
jgi:signal transduction histidine kinase